MSKENQLKGLVKNIYKLQLDIILSLKNAKQIQAALERKNELKYEAYVSYMKKINENRWFKYNISAKYEFIKVGFRYHRHANERANSIYYAISRTFTHIKRLKKALKMVENKNTSEMILDEEFYYILKLYDKGCIDTESYIELDRYI